MKLVIHNNDELSAAVAEHVVGFSFPTAPKGGRCDKWLGADYSGSVDAVLPLLEKMPFDITIYYSDTCCTWTVRLLQRFTGKREYVGKDETLARAMCTAMLHANGYEVIFA